MDSLIFSHYKVQEISKTMSIGPFWVFSGRLYNSSIPLYSFKNKTQKPLNFDRPISHRSKVKNPES